jgi:chemotaxis protein CheC
MTITYNDIQIDALRELGNIGSGNAATSLSTMLNTLVDLEVTQVALENWTANSNKPEMINVLHGITGSLKGVIWLNLHKSDCDYIASLLTGGMDMDSMLVIPEVSNILCGSYLSSLSNMFNFAWELQPPEFVAVNTYLKDHPELVIEDDKQLCIQNNLKIGDQNIRCNISVALANPSLGELLAQCGVA